MLNGVQKVVSSNLTAPTIFLLHSLHRLADRWKPKYLLAMQLGSLIQSDPDILGGTPVFAGTRVPVKSLFDHLEAGDSINDFLEGFPSVRREQVIGLLEKSREELLQPA